MSGDFVHLHTHTDYSLLDGACSIDGLYDLAKEYNMPAVAMTDHGFMGGAIKMYQSFKDVKPIIGTEFYVSPTTRFDKDPNVKNIRGYHLLLLAKNNEGYKSLCKLHSIGAREGFYYRPRIDHELMETYNDGLIALTACIGGEIPKMILQQGVKVAKERLKWFIEVYGRDNLYLELMDHGIPEEKVVNKELILLSKEFEIPLVATNDVHYLKAEHAKAHEMMLCLQTKSTLNDTSHFKFSSDEFYLKTEEQMRELFKEVPQAITNTREIAEKCNIEFDFETNHYPEWPLEDTPQYTDRKELLRDLCLEEVPKLYKFDPKKSEFTEQEQVVMDRIDFELGVIDKMGFCSYFLVVRDFIFWSHDQNIPVGPGRGSGAGSIIAYLARITDIEPLRFNLLFERFLNPDRVSPPDFDIDFCERRRCEVIEYVRKKYGEKQVAQIGTYGTLKAKVLIKDVARVSGYEPAIANKICKTMEGSPKNFEKAKKESPDFKILLETDEATQSIVRDAMPLVGLNRNMSTHAAGVIIGNQELDNVVPLSRAKDGSLQTQFSAVPCEDLGLLKMDFLGLKTLTVIQDAIDNVKESRNILVDWDEIGLEDEKTYELVRRGDTIGVFQLESGGMQGLCRNFGVTTIEHIIALLAIYRPGPMQFIPDIIATKKGEKKIEDQVAHPMMIPIVKETYGFMIYQEQIMQVVQVLAGFSLGGADILRRAIGKKKVDVLMAQKQKFVEGCFDTNKISEEDADKIWAQIEKFAEYGFNKSHSAAYGFLTYRTAYLKAHYPEEFMAAILSSELSNAEKITFFINECKEMGTNVLSPDVNGSGVNFSVDNGDIRFGLGAIKGVGEAATHIIIDAKKESGKFESLLDFFKKTKGKVGTKMVENLVKSGAFDRFELKRSQLIEMIPLCSAEAATKIRDEAAGQGSLFDFLDEDEQEEFSTIPIPDIPEFEERAMLDDEKELLGFYVSGHPLGEHENIIKDYSTHTLLEVGKMEDYEGLRVGGMVKSVMRKMSKNNKPFAIIQFEDFDTTIECAVFGKTYEDYNEIIINDAPIFIEGVSSKREEGDKTSIRANKIIPLENIQAEYTEEIHIHVYENTNSEEQLKDIKALCDNFPGKTILILCVKCGNGEIVFIESANLKVKVTENLLKGIHDILGERRYKLKANRSLPELKKRWVSKQ